MLVVALPREPNVYRVSPINKLYDYITHDWPKKKPFDKRIPKASIFNQRSIKEATAVKQSALRCVRDAI